MIGILVEVLLPLVKAVANLEYARESLESGSPEWESMLYVQKLLERMIKAEANGTFEEEAKAILLEEQIVRLAHDLVNLTTVDAVEALAADPADLQAHLKLAQLLSDAGILQNV